MHALLLLIASYQQYHDSYTTGRVPIDFKVYLFYVHIKGQLISEYPFWDFKFSKNPPKKFDRFLPIDFNQYIWRKHNTNNYCFKWVPIRVEMVGTNHVKVLTQCRHMPMGQFRANIFLIKVTSTYFWTSEVFKNQSSKSWLFWLSGWNIWKTFVN